MSKLKTLALSAITALVMAFGTVVATMNVSSAGSYPTIDGQVRVYISADIWSAFGPDASDGNRRWWMVFYAAPNTDVEFISNHGEPVSGRLYNPWVYADDLPVGSRLGIAVPSANGQNLEWFWTEELPRAGRFELTRGSHRIVTPMR